MGYSEMGRDPEPHIPIFNGCEMRVKEADFLEAFFTNHDRTGWNKVGFHELGKCLRDEKYSRGVSVDPLRCERQIRNALVDEFSAKAGYESDITMPLEEIELELQLIRGPEIVGIQKTEEISTGRLDAGIARGGGAAIFLVKIFEPALKSVQDFPRFVVRSVVHYDDFVIAVGLRQRALQCLTNKPSRVVCGDDNTDEWQSSSLMDRHMVIKKQLYANCLVVSCQIESCRMNVTRVFEDKR
jgi:hypothetical protein